MDGSRLGLTRLTLHHPDEALLRVTTAFDLLVSCESPVWVPCGIVDASRGFRLVSVRDLRVQLDGFLLVLQAPLGRNGPESAWATA